MFNHSNAQPTALRAAGVRQGLRGPAKRAHVDAGARCGGRSSWSRPGLPKRLLWLGATLLALEILWLVLANLFLRFGLQPIVNRSPDDILLTYESAYTLWPGVAHVRGFRLRSQSRTVEWRVESDQAEVTVDLLALFGKKFHATRVRATGVAFRLRGKVDDSDAPTARTRAFAPIAGFADPPLAPIGPAEPPVSDAAYSSWIAHLDDIDAEVNEVWLQEFRLLGPTRARGGFFLKPERVVQVGPTLLEVDGGELRIGDRPVLTAIQARIASVVGAFDPREPASEAVREISGRGELAGTLAGIDFIRLYLGDPPALRAEDGRGVLRVDLRLQNGEAMPGTTVSVASPRLVLGKATYAATLAFHANARVDGGVSGPEATGELILDDASVAREGVAIPGPSIHDARARFQGLPRNVAGPFAIVRTELDVPARIPDLRWLLPAPPPGEARPVSLTGAATLRARADLDRDFRATGVIDGRSDALAIDTPTFAARGRLTTKVGFHDADAGARSVTLDPSVVLAEEVAITREHRTHPGGTLRVDVTRGQVDAGLPRDVALAVAASIPDLGWLAWRAPEGGDPRLSARSGALNARLVLRRPLALFDGPPQDAEVTGTLALRGAGDVRYRDVTIRSDVTATATLDGLDLGRRSLRLRAMHVASRDVVIDRGHHHTAGWWGDFEVPRLDVASHRDVDLDLRVAARCKDGAPFTALLTGAGTVPGWTGTLFPMNGLTASVDLRRARAKLDLDVSARGSSAHVAARLHDLGGAMDGVVDVKTKLLSVGVRSTAGQTHVSFLAGEDWLAARIAEVKQKEEQDETNASAPAGGGASPAR